jgi:hypothetical protein
MLKGQLQRPTWSDILDEYSSTSLSAGEQLTFGCWVSQNLGLVGCGPVRNVSCRLWRGPMEAVGLDFVTVWKDAMSKRPGVRLNFHLMIILSNLWLWS